MRSTHLKNTVVNIIHTIILMCTFTGEIRNIIKTIRDGNVMVNEFNGCVLRTRLQFNIL